MTLKDIEQKTSQMPKLNNWDEVLGLYEAVTKLSVSAKHKKEEIPMRLSNILIGVSLAAQAFKIKDLDKALEKRLSEFEAEFK